MIMTYSTASSSTMRPPLQPTALNLPHRPIASRTSTSTGNSNGTGKGKGKEQPDEKKLQQVNVNLTVSSSLEPKPDPKVSLTHKAPEEQPDEYELMQVIFTVSYSMLEPKPDPTVSLAYTFMAPDGEFTHTLLFAPGTSMGDLHRIVLK
ncbi:hypothetical protein FA15DRAFT_655889 [Coprinopsis marcescibilis]|uniref:Uncharacterized protein n=1 Tax=Coprinopsis marcescibilis TaxID=230819 RepID=A0A5C3KUX9_COPMA|nr:hypothetical protein FA15DRAFT_655889 [Coprinopsis marcescibilis]